VRYRTLSGGIGRSPSPTNSDYLDDDDDDFDEEMTTVKTTIFNGKPKTTIDQSNASCTNNVSSKASRPTSHLTKASKLISYQQKASVHNVRRQKSHHKSFPFSHTLFVYIKNNFLNSSFKHTAAM
jgi:hypothetical protein